MKYKITATVLAYLSIIGMLIFFTTPIVSAEVDYDYYWSTNVSGNTIVVDGSLSDWVGVNSSMYWGTQVYIGYDATNVYVACTWQDIGQSDDISVWNKTGMLDADDADWELLDGSDDRLAVGFVSGMYADVWVWTASNITHSNYAYELNGTLSEFGVFEYVPDSGDLPFVINSNGTDLSGNTKPIYDSAQQTISDYSTIPNGTMINGWFSQTPTGSQTDVTVAAVYDGTNWTVEFSRARNTGNADDLNLNLGGLSNKYFMISRSNNNDAEDMDFTLLDVDETRVWFDMTTTTTVYLLGNAKVTNVGNNNGTAVDGEYKLEAFNWNFVNSFPKRTTYFAILAFLATLLATILLTAASAPLMNIISSSVGIVAGLIVLLGGIFYLSWINWFSTNVELMYTELTLGFESTFVDLELGVRTIIGSSTGLGFYISIIIGVLFAVVMAVLLVFSILDFIKIRKKTKKLNGI
jgi:hypothetical protein